MNIKPERTRTGEAALALRARIPFETTAQAQKREGFIRQERALRALKWEWSYPPGYNVFVCGLAGTSRGGTIAQMIEELHPATKPQWTVATSTTLRLDRPAFSCFREESANTFKKDVQAGIISCAVGSASLRR
jgi:hypothetical protein